MNATPAHTSRVHAWRAIAWGGLIAGTCDLVFALLFYGARGAKPLNILRSIAGGLLGRDAARAGGLPTAALGATLHYLIALIWAALFVATSRRVTLLIRQPLLSGLVYGAIVYVGMNMIVLPLSALHRPAWPLDLSLGPVLIHLLGIGLPIALAARVYLLREDAGVSAENSLRR